MPTKKTKSPAQLQREIDEALLDSRHNRTYHATRVYNETFGIFQGLMRESPPQFEVAEDLIRAEGTNLRELMGGERVLSYVLETKKSTGDDWRTTEKKVGGGFTPASKNGQDDRTRTSWVDFYVWHGPSRYSFTKKLDKPLDADDARKMIVATIWELTKRLAPFSLDTDEATIQGIAEKTVKQRHNIAKRYQDIA